MSSLLNPATFEFFATYLLAGYVIIIVRSRFVSTQRPATSDVLVEAVIFSLINQLLFRFLLWLAPARWEEVLGTQTLFFTQVLLLPGILGALFGYNLSKGWNEAFWRRLSLPIARPSQRAYDFAFSEDREVGFVIVTFGDGSQVFGLFGEHSLAASDAEHGDIYLERIYDVSEDGQWQETTPPRSALMSLKDMKSIEFLTNEDTDD
ncbi:hypothetical protein SAMN05444149_103742 [Pseudosulfitobacter pseudonitzschiae]|uniref:Uncharacterized protein n=1 Tax=Pseudosulfitobacter pseudonitzschiae TaxID=1402135 RepID=A0A073J303_9RHOB|nr:DUF6338 family protein [Pseudosulfitobacter pseudonitzschiae]KEJ96369.1 hypothetical protein SUH3_13490 [Pseudosulfitobacter pseudonitzschiae]QKS08151.1 hypothetical protein HT745_06430 [Pseudosulfitobacter pseudonitzschiae]SHF36887.1 hypothetical protein SAMN05444149_103742 [Pseudosulfitobacter pseudonitzschiae]